MKQRCLGSACSRGIIVGLVLVPLLMSDVYAKRIRVDKAVKQYSQSLLGQTYRLQVPVAVIVISRRIGLTTRIDSNGITTYRAHVSGIPADSTYTTSLEALLDAVKTRRLQSSILSTRDQLGVPTSVMALRAGDIVSLKKIEFVKKGKDDRKHGTDIIVEIEGQIGTVLDLGWEREGVARVPVLLQGKIGTQYESAAIRESLDKLLELDTDADIMLNPDR